MKNLVLFHVILYASIRNLEFEFLIKTYALLRRQQFYSLDDIYIQIDTSKCGLGLFVKDIKKKKRGTKIRTHLNAKTNGKSLRLFNI